MATSDRTQLFLVKFGQLADLKTLSNAQLVSQQLDQRHYIIDLSPSAPFNGSANASLWCMKLDRNIQVISATLMPTAAIAQNNTNFVGINVVFTNSNTQTCANGVLVAAANTTNVGNAWAAFTTLAMAVQTANSTILSGNSLGVFINVGGVGGAIANGTQLDIVYQEV